MPPCCPDCGSDKLVVKVAAADTLSVDLKELLKLKARTGLGKAGVRRELVQGDELTQKTDRWDTKNRLIDKDEDRYRECIIEQDTGKVLRDVDEPLTAHRDRGSARKGKPATKARRTPDQDEL